MSASPETLTALRREAERLAALSPPDAARVLALVASLKAADDFGTARRLLGKVREQPLAVPFATKLAQQQALCTYKDPTIGAERRYREAIALLEGIGLARPDCRDTETLGLGGAVYKRLWQSTGIAEHLHTALGFYRAGWERDADTDLGWCAGNAAFILDQLAFLDEAAAARSGQEAARAGPWREQAAGLRRAVLNQVPAAAQAKGLAETYWVLATLAEATFGLGDFDAAGQWLGRAAAAQLDEWMRQSTAEQLAALARLHRITPPAPELPAAQWHPAWTAIARLVGEGRAAALDSRRGKVGLALSGGGFRAALFHLGVMARLAEVGALRAVETLSTVSGGSILGAQYYLELRHLLQTRPDGRDGGPAPIGDADYVQLVRRVIDSLVAGVAHNIRVRALGNLWANLRMVFSKAYSRSMRLGELYESVLFSRVGDEHRGGAMRRLADLIVNPHDKSSDATAKFNPRSGNWSRRAKVPNLMLNTTSLNSGHNWHFTARWMGEPPGLAGDEIDMNERYRRLYYEQAPRPALQDYPLAYAVAASSCVPAMFEPLPLEGLYPDRTVRLVDGGVHDNQGMAALLDDGCELILCSDASGQMDDQHTPADGQLGVFSRVSSILQDRVREAQYRDLRSRADAGALQGLFFVHLKQDLEPAPVRFVGCLDPEPAPAAGGATRYGVDRELQRCLSKTRTDLDSFSEVECYALMASGYQLARWQLDQLGDEHRKAGHADRRWGGFEVDAPMAADASGKPLWPFAPLFGLMALPPGSADPRRVDLGLQLRKSSVMFFRVWHLVRWLEALGIAAGVVLLGAIAAWVVLHWDRPIGYETSVGAIVVAALVAIAALFAPALRLLQPREATKTLLGTVFVALAGFVASRVHLALFEPMLRARGRLARLLALD